MTARGRIVAAICVAVLLGFAYWNIQQARQRVAQLTQKLNEERPMTTSWTSGGLVRSWTTPRIGDELPEVTARRHRDEVAAVMTIFPRDP